MMVKTPRQKLPKLERRNQLLDTARKIIIEEGADSLTLGHLAERAGVTKPITYGHFGSRSKLLMALYEELHRHHLAELAAAIGRAPKRLQDIARVAADIFMACSADDPYTYAVMGALQGDTDGKRFYAKTAQEYVLFYTDLFRPYCRAKDRDLAILCIGIVGAAESLANEMLEGRIQQEAASRGLSTLIVGSLTAEFEH